MEHGGTLDTSGGFTLASKNADAKLALSDLALPSLQPYVANAVAASIADGTLGASLPLHVDWSTPAPSIQVGAGTVSLKSLKLAPNGNSAAPVGLNSAEARIRKIDVDNRTAALDSVVLNGLTVSATRLKNGAIDLAALAGPARSGAGAQRDTQDPEGERGGSGMALPGCRGLADRQQRRFHRRNHAASGQVAYRTA